MPTNYRGITVLKIRSLAGGPVCLYIVSDQRRLLVARERRHRVETRAAALLAPQTLSVEMPPGERPARYRTISPRLTRKDYYLIDRCKYAPVRRRDPACPRTEPTCLSGISQMCFRILGIIRCWAELILAPLRCRSTAKALTWSYLVWILNPRVSHGVLDAVQTFAARGLSDADQAQTAIHQLHLATIIQIINIYRVLYPLSASLLPSCCSSFSLRLIPPSRRDDQRGSRIAVRSSQLSD